MAAEISSPIHWAYRFLRADAAQPVGITRMLLSELRWNQWVLLQWRQFQDSRFYPFKQYELRDILTNADPGTTVIQALHLEEKTQTQTVVSTDDEILAPASYKPAEPWLSRRVLLDNDGNPLAIGAPPLPRAAWSLNSAMRRETARSEAGPPIKSPPANLPRDYLIVRVFYATDRSSKNGGTAYSERRDPSETIHFGTCDVTIPDIHTIGKLESPSWWRFELRWNPKKHIVLRQILEVPEQRFLNLLQTATSSAPARNAFVFIHGSDVSFEDAARRTAQLTHDLQFNGIPILYSWPCAGGLLGYPADEETIKWTHPHFVYFLTQIAYRTGVSTLHIIAHSMGNRALLKALESFPPSGYISPINQIVLTAPDIDSGEFMQIAASIQKPGKRTTLYASSNDKAIKLSKVVHQYPRAGESGPDIVVVGGVDTIDASEVDTSFIGHSYFAEKRTVVSDLFYLLREGKPPSERHSLEEKTLPQGLYWAFRP